MDPISNVECIDNPTRYYHVDFENFDESREFVVDTKAVQKYGSKFTGMILDFITDEKNPYLYIKIWFFNKTGEWRFEKFPISSNPECKLYFSTDDLTRFKFSIEKISSKDERDLSVPVKMKFFSISKQCCGSGKLSEKCICE